MLFLKRYPSKILFGFTTKQFTDVDWTEFIEEHLDEITEMLMEHCRNRAYKIFLEQLAERKDPYGFRGISENDFH